MNTIVIDAEKYFEFAVDNAARFIKSGEIAALPTETVYGLGASAFDGAAVEKVFLAKGRPCDNPLIVHICDSDMLEMVAVDLPDVAYALAGAFWPGPLSLVLPKNKNIARNVTGNLMTVAVRMPAHTVTRAVISRAGVPVAAPSANLSGHPSPTSAAHVYADLNGRVPFIADGGLCRVGVESTVLDITGEIPVILRPGAVTKEMIESVAGSVKTHPGLHGAQSPPSPGMKYRHYAPKARVYYFEGDKNSVAQSIVSLYYLNRENAVVLCPEEYAPLYRNLNAKCLGATRADAEKALFGLLRDADDEGFSCIYFHYAEYMGEAVKNRILKAAESRERV